MSSSRTMRRRADERGRRGRVVHARHSVAPLSDSPRRSSRLTAPGDFEPNNVEVDGCRCGSGTDRRRSGRDLVQHYPGLVSTGSFYCVGAATHRSCQSHSAMADCAGSCGRGCKLPGIRYGRVGAGNRERLLQIADRPRVSQASTAPGNRVGSELARPELRAAGSEMLVPRQVAHEHFVVSGSGQHMLAHASVGSSSSTRPDLRISGSWSPSS